MNIHNDDAAVELLRPEDDILLTNSQVCRRYGGKSRMWIWRLDHDPQSGFPPRIDINGRGHRRLSQLLRYERQRAASPRGVSNPRPGKVDKENSGKRSTRPLRA